MLPVCDSPLFFNSFFNVTTVSPFQFLWDERRTLDARFAVCCCIGLEATAWAAVDPEVVDADWVDVAARSSPLDTLRLIIVDVSNE